MRLLRLTPWRRGPLLLTRRPGVALALLAAALPPAAAPLFLSSSQHATLHRLVDQTCPWLIGLQVTSDLVPPLGAETLVATGTDRVVGADLLRERAAVLAADPVPGLTDPVTTLHAGWWESPSSPAARAELGEITLPVVAIYQDLRRVPTSRYWCGVREVFAGPPGAELNPDEVVLPTALVDIPP